MSIAQDTLAAVDVEQAIHAFTGVMAELQGSHKALEERAERMEADLFTANKQLATKVAELETLHRHLDSILAALPTGVIERAPSGKVVRMNSAARRLLGLDPNSVDLDELSSIELDAQEGSTLLAGPDGSERNLDLRRAEVCDDSGEISAHLQILEDRTELTRITEHLHNQSKMVALGTMAGGIAHEVRNPMNAIRGFASLLLRSHGEDSTVQRHAERITAGVDEVDAILSSVLAFADPERLRLEDQNAQDCVLEAVQLVSRDAGDMTPWNVTVVAPPIPFVGDGFQLRIALRNLVANAIQVQPSGGTIHVRAEAIEDALVFEVDDAGPGIDPSLLRRLRDPFFTTRAEGTGLGLPLVDTIARLHGGSLEIESTPSPLGGARFVLRVPTLLRSSAR